MKGIAIIAVIVGHLTDFGRQFIFSFHMPLFFVIAGFLYKDGDVWGGVHKDFKRLIIPYIVTASFIFISYFAISFIHPQIDLIKWFKAVIWGSGSVMHTSPLFGDIPSIGAIWFLFALFWCKLTFSLLRIGISNNLLLALCSIAISLVASSIDKYLINLPFAILPGLSSIVFYTAGYIIKQLDGFNKISNSKMWVGILLIVWMLSTFIPDRPLGLVTSDFPIYPLSVLGGISATLVIYSLTNMFFKQNSYIAKFFVWMGEVSLVVLCLHLIDLDIPLRNFLGIHSEIISIILDLGFCIFGTILLSRFTIGRKLFKINKVNIISGK